MVSVDDDHFMGLALQEADRAGREGNPAVGAVVVWGGQVISRGRNLALSSHDPTAHAEVVALREAGTVLRQVNFTGCTLYTTLEPCPMCFGAILVSGISRLVVGAQGPGASRWGEYSAERLLALAGLANRIEVTRGVRAVECLDVRGLWENT